MTSTHGMDPLEVRALGHDLQGKADEIRRKAQWLDRLVANAYWTGPNAVRFKTQWWPAHRAKMWSVAEGLDGFGQSALNNAAEQERVSQASGGSVPGAGAVTGSNTDPGIAGLTQASTPREVAVWWHGLNDAEQQRLVAEYPHLIGNADGIPPAIRYQANQMNVERYLDGLVATRDELAGEGASELVLDVLDAQIAKFQNLATDGAQVILFDPSAGTIAQVFGDIATADDIAVVIPGVGNDYGNYTGDNARNLYEAGSGDTATIMWLGYDTPSGVADPAALGIGRAEDAAENLVSFTRGLQQTTAAEVSVVAHSYGTVVATEAAKAGMAVNRVLLVGSPGVPADNASVFKGAEVYAGKNSRDYIDDLANPFHGSDPTSESFGAESIDGNWDSLIQKPGSSHSTYFDPGSPALNDMARIIETTHVRDDGMVVTRTVHDDGSATEVILPTF